MNVQSNLDGNTLYKAILSITENKDLAAALAILTETQLWREYANPAFGGQTLQYNRRSTRIG